jgi:hypothetical protein
MTSDFVMAGLVPAIHAFRALPRRKDVARVAASTLPCTSSQCPLRIETMGVNLEKIGY